MLINRYQFNIVHVFSINNNKFDVMLSIGMRYSLYVYKCVFVVFVEIFLYIILNEKNQLHQDELFCVGDRNVFQRHSNVYDWYETSLIYSVYTHTFQYFALVLKFMGWKCNASNIVAAADGFCIAKRMLSLGTCTSIILWNNKLPSTYITRNTKNM